MVQGQGQGQRAPPRPQHAGPPRRLLLHTLAAATDATRGLRAIVTLPRDGLVSLLANTKAFKNFLCDVLPSHSSYESRANYTDSHESGNLTIMPL